MIIFQKTLPLLLTFTPIEPYGVRSFSETELQQIDHALEMLPVKNLYRFCIQEGIKPAYAYAYMISNLDLDNRCILTHRKLVRSPMGGSFHIEELAEEQIQYLSAYSIDVLKNQLEMRLAMNASESDLLFTSESGKQLTPPTMHIYNKMLKTLSGVSDVNLQALMSDQKYKRKRILKGETDAEK